MVTVDELEERITFLEDKLPDLLTLVKVIQTQSEENLKNVRTISMLLTRFFVSRGGDS